MLRKNGFLILATLLACNTVGAADTGKVNEEDVEKIHKTLSTFVPGLKPDSIKRVDLPPLYEVVLGAEVIYVSADGRYMLQGDLVDVPAKVNLTEETRSVGRLKIIGNIDPSTMIAYTPKKTQHTVHVFTDIDCPYCRKMHKEMQAYNDLGIEIRYLAFPRAGIGSESYDKAVAAWCADDPAQAMTDAKAGKRLKKAADDCVSPVKDHLGLVRTLGLTGTPALILEDGSLLPGYVPAERLKKIVEDASANAKQDNKT